MEIKRLVDGITHQTHPTDFKIAANELINELRSQFDDIGTDSAKTILIRDTSIEGQSAHVSRQATSLVSLKDAFLQKAPVNQTTDHCTMSGREQGYLNSFVYEWN